MTPRTLSRESVAAGRKGLLVVLPILLLTACTQNAAQPIAAPPTVRLTAVAPMESDTARFTGTVRARTESNLGFRVAGKVLERLVDPGDRVKAGQPLMRLDPVDFALALNSAQAAVQAARAQQVRAAADEQRSGKLVASGWSSAEQLYDQNKAAADAAWRPARRRRGAGKAGRRPRRNMPNCRPMPTVS